MKKQFFGLFAFVMAIAIVSFSAFKSVSIAPNDPVYVTYDGSGPQSDITNYNFATHVIVQPAPCNQSNRLCWFKVTDKDLDNDVDAADFTASFNALDAGSASLGTLDEQAEQTGILEKRF